MIFKEWLILRDSWNFRYSRTFKDSLNRWSRPNCIFSGAWSEKQQSDGGSSRPLKNDQSNSLIRASRPSLWVRQRYPSGDRCVWIEDSLKIRDSSKINKSLEFRIGNRITHRWIVIWMNLNERFIKLVITLRVTHIYIYIHVVRRTSEWSVRIGLNEESYLLSQDHEERFTVWPKVAETNDQGRTRVLLEELGPYERCSAYAFFVWKSLNCCLKRRFIRQIAKITARYRMCSLVHFAVQSTSNKACLAYCDVKLYQ